LTPGRGIGGISVKGKPHVRVGEKKAKGQEGKNFLI